MSSSNLLPSNQTDWLRGAYALSNNVWGEASDAGWQGISAPERRGYSWRWDWGLRPDPAPVSYPSVIHGRKPWAAELATPGLLPCRLDRIRQLRSRHDYLLSANGRCNVAYNLWLTDGAQAGPEAIRAEVMIWLEWQGDIQPAGIAVAHGADDELWFGRRSEPDAAWDCHTLRMRGKAAKAQPLDLLSLLRRLPLSGALHLADVEFGTEIWDGSGRFWLPEFEVEVLTD